MKYILRKRLEELDGLLSDRDKAILRSLEMCRYLTSGQIRRLHFLDHASQAAALRAANRGMLKLKEYGLTEAFKRQIGGARAGSSAKTWLLTEAGNKLLHLNDTFYTHRKRFYEPELIFLKHTVAVSEIYVQLTEICRLHRLKQASTELEPACWRGYTGENGKPANLRPDGFAVIVNGKYEDRYFLEVDLGTEAPCIVIRKSKRYIRYYKSGIEQKVSGVFPLVVWIVPGLERKESLQRHIAKNREITVKKLFMVIMPDEFETLICQGAEALKAKGDNTHES